MTEEVKKYRRGHRISIGRIGRVSRQTSNKSAYVDMRGAHGADFHDPIAAGDFAMQQLRKREEFEAQQGTVKTLMLLGVPVPVEMQMMPRAQIAQAFRESGLLK